MYSRVRNSSVDDNDEKSHLNPSSVANLAYSI